MESNAICGTESVVAALLEYRKKHPLKTSTFTPYPEVNKLNSEDPFAFLVAACIDRGALAENCWCVPYWLREKLGHLEAERIAQLSVDELEAILRELPKKPRYPRQSAETILDCASQVVQRWNGAASQIWNTTHVRDITARLQSIRGVGRGIAHMIVNILISDGKLRLPDSELKQIDVKPDIHVQRVFYRTGLAENQDAQSAINAARIAHRNYPGALDQPAWQIGREYCRPTSPRCGECPLERSCIKRVS